MKLDSMEIIGITTGSRALQREDPESTGHALRDCHAEVLARRCLLRYCYEQLKLCLDGNSEQSIFEPIDHTHRFRLRQSIAFHLYISMAPCGDSRLFSLRETIVDPSSLINADSRHLPRRSRGVLRRKVDGAEGTLPTFTDLDGDRAHPGEQLSSMSCSDKLCRWNFVGLQGKLTDWIGFRSCFVRS
jgi:double stranded RNA-specific editase B